MRRYRNIAVMPFFRFLSGIFAATLLLGTSAGVRGEPSCTLCLYGPDNMAFDSAGQMYVTDSDHVKHSRIVRLSPSGRMTWQWRGFTYRAGARNGPEGIALAANGDILVTDGPSRVLRITPGGTQVRVFGNGLVRFSDLGHVAVSKSGDTYVAEAQPNRIYKFHPNGALAAVWHRPKGRGSNAWSGPETIAVQPNGNLVVEDWANRRVEILSPHGNTIASFGSPGRAPGQFLATAGLTVDSHGKIFVTDIALHRVQKFDPRGHLVSVIQNKPNRRLFARGPSAVAVDSHGNLYSPDGTSIVKYSQSGRVIARWQ